MLPLSARMRQLYRVLVIAVLSSTLVAARAEARERQHVVQSGQTLGAIAKRYGVSVEAISKANGLRSQNHIRVGQSLTIPTAKQTGKPSKSERVHTVRPGDTLGKIARRYGTSIDTITRANRIRRNAPIRVGQELVVPKLGEKVSVPLRTHVVVSGNTLGSIARRYGVTIDALCKANRIRRTSPIRVGQELIVPDPSDADGSKARRAAATGKTEVVVAPKQEAPPRDKGMQRLEVPGSQSAYYFEPIGRGRLGLRPVIMYLHGRGAIPGQYCQRWANVARRFGWLVCPVGPVDRGAGVKRAWGNDPATARRIVMHTLRALRKKYGRRVQLYGNTLMGFSEGAFVAMNVGLREPRAFNRWLILGADTDYYGARARAALARQRKRVRRVYLITGRHDIVYDDLTTVRKWFSKLGVPVRVSAPKDMGHEVALERKPAMYKAALRWLERG